MFVSDYEGYDSTGPESTKKRLKNNVKLVQILTVSSYDYKINYLPYDSGLKRICNFL
jgi:hypothetical protein